MSTTPKLLFDVSSPDRELQRRIFDELVALADLGLSPVDPLPEKVSGNPLVYLAEFRPTLLNIGHAIKESSARAHISSGLFADLYTNIEPLDEAAAKYLEIRDQFAGDEILIYHLHVRSDVSKDQIRRMALALMYTREHPRKKWFTFDKFDLGAISAKIRECLGT